MSEKPRAADLLILGGGPAGLAAALAAAQESAAAGRRLALILVERKKRWGEPVQCAGFVPRLLGRTIDLPPEAIASRTDELRIFVEEEGRGGQGRKGKGRGEKEVPEPAAVIRAPGYVLRREILEASLAAEARARGVELLQPARATAMDGGAVEVRLDGTGGATRNFRARIVLAADGPLSLAHRACGMSTPPGPLAIGRQNLYPAGPAGKNLEPEVHFAPRYGANYAWCFPRGELVEVGLALDAERRQALPDELARFAARLAARGVIAPELKPVATAVKAIPVGGPPAATVVGATLLAGDAAGQVNPLTGAGILAAVTCGEMAGRWAARALLAGDTALLAGYEAEWRDLLGAYFARALAAREWLATRPPAEFGAAVLQAWRGRAPGARVVAPASGRQ